MTYPPSSLILNKGKWYVQVTIPTDLRPHFKGAVQKKLSTGTSDKSIAKRLQHDKAALIYSKFDDVQPNLVEDLLKILPVPSDVEDQIRSNGVTKDLFPLLEGMASSLATHTGDLEEDIARGTIQRDALSVLRQLEDDADTSVRLSDAKSRWLAGGPYPSGKTTKEAETALDEFIKFGGDPAINNITKHDGYQFAEMLADDGKSNSTIRKKVGYVSRCLAHCERKGLLDTNGLSGISLGGYGSKKAHWQTFTDEELCSLFSLEMEDHLRLLLSILVTTGMRLDEAALLDWADIKTTDGILHFDLTESSKVLKNIGSARKVPIHDTLLGQLSPAGRTGQIFPQFKRNADGKAQGPASKALMPLVRTVSSNPKKVVHSLRGTLKDKLRDSGVLKEINDFITGHSSGDVAGSYGSGPSLKVRQGALNSVVHPWLM